MAIGATSAQLGDEHHADRTNMAVNYIFDHYMRELPLEEVASHLGMKPTYFSRFFKRATGRCYVEFVNSLRISKSCELLLDNDKPVTEDATCVLVGIQPWMFLAPQLVAE